MTNDSERPQAAASPADWHNRPDQPHPATGGFQISDELGEALAPSIPE